MRNILLSLAPIMAASLLPMLILALIVEVLL